MTQQSIRLRTRELSMMNDFESPRKQNQSRLSKSSFVLTLGLFYDLLSFVKKFNFTSSSLRFSIFTRVDYIVCLYILTTLMHLISRNFFNSLYIIIPMASLISNIDATARPLQRLCTQNREWLKGWRDKRIWDKLGK